MKQSLIIFLCVFVCASSAHAQHRKPTPTPCPRGVTQIRKCPAFPGIGEIFVAPALCLCFHCSWPKDLGQKKATRQTQCLDYRYVSRIISLVSTTESQNKRLSVATITGFAVARKRTFPKNRLRVESPRRKSSYGKRSV